MQTSAFLTVTFLLTADTSFALINVRTEASVNVSCNDMVTLNCSIEANLSLLEYSWKNSKLHKLCSSDNNTEVLPGFQCEYTNNMLVLTISNAQPSSNTYICSVKAESDHGANVSKVHVSECTDVNSQQPYRGEIPNPNHDCAPGCTQMNFLLSLTVWLCIVLESGI